MGYCTLGCQLLSMARQGVLLETDMSEINHIPITSHSQPFNPCSLANQTHINYEHSPLQSPWQYVTLVPLHPWLSMSRLLSMARQGVPLETDMSDVNHVVLGMAKLELSENHFSWPAQPASRQLTEEVGAYRSTHSGLLVMPGDINNDGWLTLTVLPLVNRLTD